MQKDTDSKFGQYYSSDGHYIYIKEEQFAEDYALFIYSKKFAEPTTLDLIREEWKEEQQFIPLGGDYYECPGNHVWYEDDVYKLYLEDKI